VAPAAGIADLYAGLGTFALPLARTHAVHAVESDRPALAALAQAAGQAMLQRVTTEARDLDRRPLRPADLARFDTVIFDPPRAGARAQAAELARSTVPVVIAVSCNPATFARDAAALLAGGYRIDRLVPVDQFLWSTHLELVAVFRRG
jgi:23S rRNA (uracil1939-C5)-methyltransferase